MLTPRPILRLRLMYNPNAFHINLISSSLNVPSALRILPLWTTYLAVSDRLANYQHICDDAFDALDLTLYSMPLTISNQYNLSPYPQNNQSRIQYPSLTPIPNNYQAHHTHNIIMTITNTTLLLLCLLLLHYVNSSQQCLTYLQTLRQLSLTNPTLFNAQMTPYLVLSGKSIDDLGFPGSCEKDPRGYSYSTVEVQIDTNGTVYTGYLGFCFVGFCGVDDLNQFGEFMIDYIFEQYPYGVSGRFIDPPLQLTFSPAALITSLLLLLLVIVAMVAPIQQWLRLCLSRPQDQFQIKSTYVDLQHPQQQLDDDRITYESTLWQRLSLKYKWKQLWKEEESYKIWSFSLFRVLAVPMMMYGQIFWLTNLGSFNYYAFYQEIYDQLYVKLAIFAYYLPDIFFLISSFLLTRKLLAPHTSPHAHLLQCLVAKFLRLLPLYLLVLIIYWAITPALHAGPVWYVYQQQAAVCNTAWWRVLLMIDNWFTEGCYPALWFVQVEIQCMITTAVLFWSVYLWRAKVGLYLLGGYWLGGLVAMGVLAAQMPVSVEIMIEPYTELYFKSYYSHLWFYLTGTALALLAQKQSLRLSLQRTLLDLPAPRLLLRLLALALLALILVRPWVWWGRTSLQLQLTLCRLGCLLAFVILFLNGMFVRETNSTVLHKYGYYMYPVMLVSYMVAECSYWSVGSFMYVSGLDVLNEAIPNFIISYGLGVFLGLVGDTRALLKNQ